jgi:ketosteroid isomerase-like protein
VQDKFCSKTGNKQCSIFAFGNKWTKTIGLFEVSSKDGNQLDKGKYLVLWKKENGKWKLHRDISNIDLPLVTK